jgi:GNAT superfamily N-acetyltransferase
LRGHRAVILPDFQGMGIGVRFTEIVAQIHLDEGHRFSRTAHPKLGYIKKNHHCGEQLVRIKN